MGVGDSPPPLFNGSLSLQDPPTLYPFRRRWEALIVLESVRDYPSRAPSSVGAYHTVNTFDTNIAWTPRKHTSRALRVRPTLQTL